MMFSRTISAAEQVRNPDIAQQTFVALLHQLMATIAKEHMDHRVVLSTKADEDGNLTLRVEY